MTRSLWLAALLAAAPASAQLQLSPVFGSHMVLQRETEAPFFGRTTPGAAIEVRPSWSGGKVFTGRAGADGRFSVRVATPEASGPHTVVIAAGNFVQRLEDVLIGEVWVCSGQSNMDWSIRESANPEQEKAGADHPRIRLLQVADQATAGPMETCSATWQVCTPDTAYNFSAIGYSYARALQRTDIAAIADARVRQLENQFGQTRNASALLATVLVAQDTKGFLPAIESLGGAGARAVHV